MVDGLGAPAASALPPPGLQTERVTVAQEAFVSVRPPESQEAPKAIPILGLNHCSWPAPKDKIAELSAFYRDLLGFRAIERPAFPFDGLWLAGPGGLMLHFIEQDPSVPVTIPFSDWKERYREEPEPWFERRGRHIALEVEDVEAAEELLRAAGVAYDRFPVPGKPVTQLFFFDPCGNAIELGNYSARRDAPHKHGDAEGEEGKT